MKSNEQIWKELKEVFIRVFNDASIEINNQTKTDDITGWTSLSHAMLIHEIEKKFEIQFDLDDLLAMQSVPEIFQKIQSKISV